MSDREYNYGGPPWPKPPAGWSVHTDVEPKAHPPAKSLGSARNQLLLFSAGVMVGWSICITLACIGAFV